MAISVDIKGAGAITRFILCVFVLAGTLPALLAQALPRTSPLLTVRSTGSATLGEGTKAQVKEKAKAGAIRKAIEEHVGVVITAQSTMKNFELAEDMVSSYARVYIKSIRELGYRYDSATETGVYEGEFVIDASSLERLSQAQTALEAGMKRPVEASVFLFDGEGRMIADGGTVREGQRFNVMVQPSVDLHSYIINRDSRGNLFRIFPNPKVSGHRNPLRRGRSYFFPPRESELIFTFDSNPGREHFYVLLSAVPLNDLDALFAQLDVMGHEQDRRDMTPIIQERIASRGIQLHAKATKARISMADGQGHPADNIVGELLSGTGAFVKMISLRHVD